MVLSRKKRQKLRAELNQNDPTPEITQIKDPENVTGKKRSRDLVKGSEVSAIFKALLAKNGGKQGFQVGAVDGGSVLNDDDDDDDDTMIEKKGNKILKVDEKSASLNDNVKKNEKKKKKKKKKVKKKKVKVEEVKPQPEPEPVVENVVISEQIVQENSKGNDDVRKVYVGGIPYYSTEDDIKSYFGECGAITEMDCMFFPETGKFRGIAIITFETEEAAENALVLDGSDMDGLYLKIQPYKTTRPSKTSNFSPPVVEGYNRIYAGNLSWDIGEDDLRKFFSDCNISAIRFGTDKETGDFKGYAHVDFADAESLNKALKLDQQLVCGRPVKISRAVPKKGVTNSTMVKPESNSEVNPVKPESNSGNYPAVEPESVSVPPPLPLPTENKSGISSGKLKRRTCYECGERGHVSSDCPKKQNLGVTNSTMVKPESNSGNYPAVEPESVSEVYEVVPPPLPLPTENKSVVSSGKLKRRTCYECGERGHVSSDCPKKQNPGVTNSTMVKPESNWEVTPVKPENNSGSNSAVEPESVNGVAPPPSENKSVVSSGKLKRRTCYECGERGHVSSDCPKKQNPGVTNSTMVKPESNWEVTPVKPENNSGSNSAVEPESVNGVAPPPSENKSVVSSGKLKRRTCYECGERGHVSSDCPKKQNPGVTNSTMVKPESNWEVTPVKPENNSGSNSAVEPESVNGVVPPPLPPPSENKSVVSSGKLKRRTCYECGERGHLSSDCPKKQNP